MTLKNLGIVINSFLHQQVIPIRQITTTLFFFPCYTSGPIEQYQTFTNKIFHQTFSLNYLRDGFLRIVIGLFKSLYIGNVLIGGMVREYGANIDQLTSLETLFFIFANFSMTYINFSGYSDIAIGTARLLGINIHENFNHPYLATNITEFWQRWHMTMGQWSIENIYKNIVRYTGKIYLPMMGLFLFIGFWHKASLQYVIWGVAHGTLLGLHQYVTRNKRRWKTYGKVRDNVAYRWLCRIATLFFVSTVSTFANASSMKQGLKIISNLIGVS